MRIKEDLLNLLANPFDKIEPNYFKGFQDKCSEIADELLNNYCIQCGKEINYYFAEIEFYYYEKQRWNQEWNEKTYPRKGKNAGDFFFHYSGFDICFESNFGKDSAKFGGILIRSLKNNQGKFITGPSVCSLEIINKCVELKTLPELTYSSNSECTVCKTPLTRYGISYKNNQKDKKLCFYDEKLKEKLKNEFENATWDYSKSKDGIVKGQKNLVRYYHRFDNIDLC